MKNTQAKTRPINDPYEIWVLPGRMWEWRVLKKWQTEDDKPYARWYCGVKSEFTYGSFEYGDVYVNEIKEYGIKLTDEEMKERLAA